MANSTRKLWAEYLKQSDSSSSQSKSRRKREGLALPPPPGARGRKGVFLGIDPSLRGTGLAVVDCTRSQHPRLVHSQTIRIPGKLPMTSCLGEIALQVEQLLNQFQIDEIAVEQSIYVQNFQTAMTLGSARGAALAMVSRKGLPITEYPPLRIKQAIVGYGRASKEQMIRTLQQLLLMKTPLPPDEADAAGVAICHAFTAV